MENGKVTASDAVPVNLPDVTNNEFFTVVGNTLLTSAETEDYARRFHIGLHAGIKNLQTMYFSGYRADGNGGSKEKPHEDILPALPAWVPYTGWGFDGIHARK